MGNLLGYALVDHIHLTNQEVVHVYTRTGNPRLDFLAGSPSPLGSQQQLKEYNYEHFRPKHLLADLWKTIRGEGLQPAVPKPWTSRWRPLRATACD